MRGSSLALLSLSFLLAVSLGLYVVSLYSSSNPSSPRQQTPSGHPELRLGNPVFTRKIVGVGDIHGSLMNAKTALKLGGVIDEEGKWILGNGMLTQTGDIVDRGTDTIALYRYFEVLRAEALAAGGHFFSLLGNHETMNAMGDWRYVTKDDIKTFKGGAKERREAMTPDGWIGKTWLQNYTITAKVPLTDFPSSVEDFSHSALSFIHAAVTPQVSYLPSYPDGLNELAQSFLFKCLKEAAPPHPPARFPGLPSSLTDQEVQLWGADSAWWWRDYALDENEERICNTAQDVMDRIGVKRLIMGHTPNFEGIQSRCSGKILLIDTGFSPAYGGPISALVINYSLSPILKPKHDGDLRRRRILAAPSQEKFSVEPEKLLEVEEVWAVYETHKDLLVRDERVVLRPNDI